MTWIKHKSAHEKLFDVIKYVFGILTQKKSRFADVQSFTPTSQSKDS